MKRRDFVAAACLVGMAPLVRTSQGNSHLKSPKQGQYIELRVYRIKSKEQQTQCNEFFRDVALPAMNRIGIKTVGVFTHLKGDSQDIYMLIPYDSLEMMATSTSKLLHDSAYVRDGADFMNAPKSDPAYERIESTLMAAFEDMPTVEVSNKKASRIFELRIYQSHSVKKGQKKIDMFNSGGEIKIFRDTGLTPVFFGESLIGAGLPNLTYMIVFDDMAAHDKNWKTFIDDPRWKKLVKDPQYKNTVSHIDKTFLKPLGFSQI